MTHRPTILRLTGSVMPYPWGSLDFIQTMLGREITGEPAAELWIGTHGGGPARIEDTGETLRDWIAADPAASLGAPVIERFGADLPFLVKVLAAAQPLSIQTHPTIEQARVGFAAENERGIAVDAPHRNYADPNHKPEMICALTEFEALCEFRHVEASATLLGALVERGAAGLRGVAERLLADDGLRDVVTWLLTMAPDEQAKLQSTLVPAARALADEAGEWSAEAALTCRLAELYPNDSGVAVALLMNLVRLVPGEALFLAARRVHAYLSGGAVEIMARSDNVLRSGLTSKHVDIAELLRVVEFKAEDPVPIRPVVSGDRREYRVPIEDFRLSAITVSPATGGSVTLAEPGPALLLCTDGAVLATDTAEGTEIDVDRGQSIFIAAGTAWTLSGDGTVYVGTTNLQG